MTEYDIDIAIGKRIAFHRKRRGMTLMALGARVGVTHQQVHKYEVGMHHIRASRLLLIADALGVSPLMFYEGILEKRAA